jgi:hypothetical protein
MLEPCVHGGLFSIWFAEFPQAYMGVIPGTGVAVGVLVGVGVGGLVTTGEEDESAFFVQQIAA